MKPKKKKLSWAEIKVKRRWKTQWKNNPKGMEYIRSTKATPAAKKRHDDNNAYLIELMKPIPAQVTLKKLMGYLDQIPYWNEKTGKERNRKSLYNRMIRRGLIKYDAGLKRWINLTHLQLPDAE